ncbi:hypothetical protein, partial [Achromobacter ruhlandii]|uniref:hypothetical protein n=1 Tax=Achromobacter ruhlandii TaxID=72557 RepID=UPI003BA0115F
SLAAGPPQGKNAPLRGSDPRSGGAWGPFLASCNLFLVFSLMPFYNRGTFNHPEIIVDNDGCSRYTTACAA